MTKTFVFEFVLNIFLKNENHNYVLMITLVFFS
jgi:hypothetical protein